MALPSRMKSMERCGWCARALVPANWRLFWIEQTKQAKMVKALSKYLNVRGSRVGALYNADRIPPNGQVLCVEGEFDAIVAQARLAKW
jgi:hypothetical protein